jgi:hypothetical protein
MTEQEKNSIINKTMSSDEWKADVARFPKEWQLQVEAVMAKALGHGIHSATFVKPDLIEASNDERA